MSTQQFYYPLTIESTRKSIKLSDTTKLVRVDASRVGALIGVQNVKFSSAGYIQSQTIQGITSSKQVAPWRRWSAYFRAINPKHILLPFNINYVLFTSSREDAIHVGFAMKLITGTQSGPFVGFSENGKTTQFLHACPYWGGNFLKLDKNAIRILRKILAALSAFADKSKMGTIIEIFRHAESDEVLLTSIRYLEFAIILEMIFLPEKGGTNGNRFKLRLSKWFNRIYKDDPKVVADNAGTIYKLRSDIAHRGTAIISKVEMECVRNYTRRALQKYILDQLVFTEEYLGNLCLYS